MPRGLRPERHLGWEKPEGSVRKGPQLPKGASSGASAPGTHLGAAAAAQRGAETGAHGPTPEVQRCGTPRDAQGKRPALARPPPDAGRAGLSRRAGPKTDGSSAARRPGRWQSSELAAPRLFVFEPRSPKLQPSGGGGGRGGGGRPAGGGGGFGGAGLGRVGPDTPSASAGCGRGPRGVLEESALGRRRTKAFLISNKTQ